MESNIFSGLIAAVFLSLSVLSGWLMLGEWRATTFFTKADVTTLARGEAPGPRLSASTDAMVLDGCLEAVSSVDGRVLPSQPRVQLVTHCLRISEWITSSSPKDAYGWFSRAYFSLELGKLAAFNEALVQAYETGPNEQWIADLRVQVAEQNLDKLEAAARRGHKADLSLMVQSPRGAEAIVGRYIRDAGFRGRIAEVVEDLPARQQQVFVSTLRAAVRGATDG